MVGAIASVGLFPLLGVNPAQGRTFTPDEEVFGKHHVVIVSDSFWQKRFGVGTQLGEQTIKLNGEIFNVVGVLTDLPKACCLDCSARFAVYFWPSGVSDVSASGSARKKNQIMARRESVARRCRRRAGCALFRS